MAADYVLKNIPVKNLQVLRIPYNLTQSQFEDNRVRQMRVLSDSVHSLMIGINNSPILVDKVKILNLASQVIERMLALSRADYQPHSNEFSQ